MTAVFDEMTGVDGGSRPAYGELSRWLGEIPSDVLDYRRREAELLFRRIGITFSVYGDADAQERALYVVAGEVDIAGDRFAAGRLLVFRHLRNL